MFKPYWIFCYITVAIAVFSTLLTEAKQEICPGAQKWYDSIDSAEVANFVEVAADVEASIDERIVAKNSIYTFAQTIAESKAPDCLKAARKVYVKGLEKLSAAMALTLGPDPSPLPLAYSQRMIGEFRGQLTALGVILKEPDDPLLDPAYSLIYK